MAVRTIEGLVVEAEPEDEEVVAVAVETATDTYLVAPPEKAEELLDLMGRRVEVTGTVIEQEDGPPVIEVDFYSEMLDEADTVGPGDDEEEEEEFEV